jgi:AcrR family transcriptional regulator
MAKGPAVRRTQEERSAAMRARLLDATVACLAARGYAGTTTVEVAKRAGVSRGAQLHHFPTKEELVTAAVEHCHARRLTEFRARVAALPAGADRLGPAIDLLGSMFESDDACASLELFVAARTNPVLRRALAPVAKRFNEEAAAVARELFPEGAALGDVMEMTMNMSFHLMEGMAVARVVEDDARRRRATLEFWKTLLAGVASQTRGDDHASTAGGDDEKSGLETRLARAAGAGRRSRANGSGLRDRRRARRAGIRA